MNGVPGLSQDTSNEIRWAVEQGRYDDADAIYKKAKWDLKENLQNQSGIEQGNDSDDLKFLDQDTVNWLTSAEVGATQVEIDQIDSLAGITPKKA
jgi:hypothetical protein